MSIFRSKTSCVDCIWQEIDVQNKKAIVIFVPVPQLRAYQKIQTRLVRELEKKFSGKHVVFIAQVHTNAMQSISDRLILECVRFVKCGGICM